MQREKEKKRKYRIAMFEEIEYKFRSKKIRNFYPGVEKVKKWL